MPPWQALMVVADLGRAISVVEDGIKMLSESLILIAFAGALLTSAEHDDLGVGAPAGVRIGMEGGRDRE